MNVYIKALRAPFLTGSLIPVIIGAAYGFIDKHFSLLLFLITALGVAALHLAANLLNDYYDAKGSDPINVRLTPFSGGSRVIQNRQVAPWCVLSIAMFFYVLSLSAAIWLVLLGRPLVLAIGILGVAAGWAYSARPLQLMSRGWGEICIFFAFGPFITLGAYYVMSGSLSWSAFALGFPQGFFIAAVIWINQFPDYEADRDAGKKNLVVRLGLKLSRYPYCIIMLAAFITVIFLVGIVGLTCLAMLSFIAFPLAFKAMKILWREYLSYEGLMPAQALTIQTLIAHGVLLSLGLVLSRLV
jgi:1,4-dihydroxy-2-naphthoate octaprenyltransferase